MGKFHESLRTYVGIYPLGSSLGERAEIEPDERSSILSFQPVADRAVGLARFLSNEYAESY
jgi:hypothetical protein